MRQCSLPCRTVSSHALHRRLQSGVQQIGPALHYSRSAKTTLSLAESLKLMFLIQIRNRLGGSGTGFPLRGL